MFCIEQYVEELAFWGCGVVTDKPESKSLSVIVVFANDGAYCAIGPNHSIGLSGASA